MAVWKKAHELLGADCLPARQKLGNSRKGKKLPYAIREETEGAHGVKGVRKNYIRRNSGYRGVKGTRFDRDLPLRGDACAGGADQKTGVNNCIEGGEGARPWSGG